MEIITYEIFRNTIKELMETEKPKQWRNGQFVFNYIEDVYGPVARTAQFKYGVDCFYDDEKIEEFIKICYEIIQKNS